MQREAESDSRAPLRQEIASLGKRLDHLRGWRARVALDDPGRFHAVVTALYLAEDALMHAYVLCGGTRGPWPREDA